jgi:glycosyltransferase involved in cell wall biosynthesis
MDGLSVIIAAHNEASVIAGTLRCILSSVLDRPLQVIVVANGCEDATAALASAFEGVEVIQTPLGNKPNALNLGDARARHFPRAYLDADIELSPDALQKVARALDDPGIHLAAPRARHVYRGFNPFLAGYYQLWRSMPYVRSAIMGSGFYAIDRELRSRFDVFPPITADDKFIRNLTAPHERRVVEGCSATVVMPASFKALLKVKTRWTYGNMELAAARPDLNENDRDGHGGAGRHVLLRPWLWPHIPAFLFVYWYARRAAARRLARKQSHWDRDASTRSDAKKESAAPTP